MAEIEEVPFEEKPQAPRAPQIEAVPFEEKPQVPQEAPAIPEALVNRISLGHRLKKVYDAFGRGFGAGFGDEPLGLSEENTKKLRELGIFRDPERGVYGPLRLWNEAWVNPTAAAADGLARFFKGVTYGVADAAVQDAVSTGTLPEDKQGRATRDMVMLLDTIGLLTGDVPASVSRPRRGPMGAIHDETIGPIPRSKAEFSNAAKAIDGEGLSNTTAKVERLYQEKGILPGEVFGDVTENPVAHQDMLSKTGKLPEHYGNPPPPPETPRLPAAESPEPPRGSGITKEALDEANAYMDTRISVGEQEPGRALTWKRLYTNYVDKLYPIFTDTRVARQLETFEDPYALSRLYAGYSGKADFMLNTATYDFNTLKNNGKSLKEVLDPFKSDLSQFRRFVVASRAAELEVRGFESGFEWDKIKVVGAARTPEMTKAFEELVDFQNRVSAQLRDSGILSEKGYEAMVEQNRLFVPFHKVADSVFDHPIQTTAGSGSMQPKNPIKNLTGADIRITDPFESIIRNTYVLTAMAERNQIATRIIDRLLELQKAIPEEAIVSDSKALTISKTDKNAVGEWLSQSGTKTESLADEIAQWTAPAKDGEITVFRNGRAFTYKVDPELAIAFKQLDKETLSTLENIIAMPARGLRAGALAAPEFPVKHLFRDFFYALASTVKGIYNPADVSRAIVGRIMKDADFENWIKGGGADVTIVAMDRNRLQHTLDKLTADTGLMTRAWNVVIDPNASYLQKGGAIMGLPFQAGSKYVIHPLQMATEFAMSIHHFAGYKKAIRRIEQENAEFNRASGVEPSLYPALADMRGQLVVKEGTSLTDALEAQQRALTHTGPSQEKKAILEAAFTARETSVDMTRIGAKMHAYNAISAFANSKIQDIDKIVRMFKDHPVKTGLTVTAGVTIPSMLLWWANKDDSRYQSLPAWQRDLFWIIPTDRWEKATPSQAALRPNDQVRVVNGELYVNNGVVFRVPKPFSLGVTFGSLPERLMEKYYNENKHAFDGFFSSVMGSTVGELTPNALIPSFEQAMNQRMFNGSTVIPHQQEKMLPEYQYTTYTTETAKALGKIISAFPGMNVRADNSYGTGSIARALSSPVLIENYISQWTGTLGMYGLAITDKALRTAGVVADPQKVEKTLADMPIIRAFTVRYPQATSQNIQTFFEKYEMNKRFLDTWMAKAKEGDIEAMQRVQALGGEQSLLKLDGFYKSLTTQYQMIRNIDALTAKGQIKPAEARQLIDSLYFGLLKSGDLAIGFVDQIEKLRSPTAQ